MKQRWLKDLTRTGSGIWILEVKGDGAHTVAVRGSSSEKESQRQLLKIATSIFGLQAIYVAKGITLLEPSLISVTSTNAVCEKLGRKIKKKGDGRLDKPFSS